MFRLLKYIILVVLGYKVLRMLFAQAQPQKGNDYTPPPQDNSQFQNNATTTTTPANKYNDAELIDYEELK